MLELGLVAIWGLICLTGYSLLSSLYLSLTEREDQAPAICCVGKEEECS